MSRKNNAKNSSPVPKAEDINRSESNVKGRKINKKLEEVAQDNFNPDNGNSVQNVSKKIKKQLSISSQNFVMRKFTDFENDYDIVEKLGEGACGSVFKVKHRALGIQRALKKIPKDPFAQFNKLEQIEILKKLDHPNILKIYEFYETDKQYMVVTDIFQGGRELFDEIDAQNKLSQQIASRIMREILVTLTYTHGMGIAHRDIKPQNILVKNIQDKDKFKLKIIDWGLGTLIQEELCNRVCGTPQYTAPQVFKGKYSISCDMWSVGILAFNMLTGNGPFQGSNTLETISLVKKCVINYRRAGFNDLSPNSKQFVSGLLQKQPEKRMTAQKALQHPWITQHHKSKEEPKVLAETLVRLKQLNISNHFGAAVVNLLNNHFCSSQQKDKLEQVFKFLDTNRDGFISKQELVAGYTKIYGSNLAQTIAEETFAKLDVNNSGTLQFSEFIAYGLRREKQKQKQKLRSAFDMFDQDKNGLISWKEVQRILMGKFIGVYEEQMRQVLSDTRGSAKQEINFEQFEKFMDTLLEKVDFIRESRRNSSVIKSQVAKQQNKPLVKVQTRQLKKTNSDSEPIQPEKQTLKKISKKREK